MGEPICLTVKARITPGLPLDYQCRSLRRLYDLSLEELMNTFPLRKYYGTDGSICSCRDSIPCVASLESIVDVSEILHFASCSFPKAEKAPIPLHLLLPTLLPPRPPTTPSEITTAQWPFQRVRD